MKLWWEVRKGDGRQWFVASMPVACEREARRIRRLHKQLPIAFPLPISVWAVKLQRNGEWRKRIPGKWERLCRCSQCTE